MNATLGIVCMVLAVICAWVTGHHMKKDPEGKLRNWGLIASIFILIFLVFGACFLGSTG